MRIFVLGLLFCTLAGKAQQKAVLYFKDKAPGEPGFTVSDAASVRRARLGVTYDQSDLPVNEIYVSQLQQSGIKVLKRSKWLNAVLVQSYGPVDWDHFPFIQKVDVAVRRKFVRATTEAVSNIKVETNSEKNFILHNGKVLTDNGFDGRGIHIAVFDAGFRGADTAAGFRKLINSERLIFKKDLVGGGDSVFQYDQHGTQTLSVMAGWIDGVFRGTAAGANYSLFVTENVASETLVEEFNWALAAEIADSLGVDIISSSLGYTTFDDPNTDHNHAQLDGKSTIVSIAAAMAARKGILVVNSAGNYRNLFWKKIGCPSDADSIITVGAVSTDSIVTSFSSPGPTADGRIKPEVTSLGLRTAVIMADGKTGESNGTSFSTPLIAGLCASLWQSSPELSNLQIRQIVMKSSHKFGDPDTNFGYGIPNFAKALGYTRYDLQSGMVVFPNPSAGELFLGTGNISGEVNFELYTSLGQQLSQTVKTVDKNTRVDLSVLLRPDLSTGTYFLKIRHSQGNEERAIIIQ